MKRIKSLGSLVLSFVISACGGVPSQELGGPLSSSFSSEASGLNDWSVDPLGPSQGSTILWSMKPQFRGQPHELKVYGPNKVSDTWREFDFKACPLSPDDYTYEWIVGLEKVTGKCEVTRVFRMELRTIVVTITPKSGGPARRYERTIAPKDYLIVSLGDSFAAGEGAPDTRAVDNPLGNFPIWADTRCHRSLKSGAALTARQIEDADPHSTVTFISLACSGATIAHQSYEQGPLKTFETKGDRLGSGILGGYRGIEPGSQTDFLPSQVDELRRLVGNRRIDAMFLSGGGNDIGFADALAHCVATYNCDDLRNIHGVHLQSNIRRLQLELPGHYSQLVNTLKDSFNVDQILLTEYPELGFRRNSQSGNIEMCHEILFMRIAGLPSAVRRDPGDLPAPGQLPLNGRPMGELPWLHSNVYVPLINMMQKTVSSSRAQGLPWHYVGGIAEESTAHGLCAPSAERWANTPEDGSLADAKGATETKSMAHPNEKGYQNYAKYMLEAFRSVNPADRVDGHLKYSVTGNPTQFGWNNASGWRLNGPVWGAVMARPAVAEKYGQVFLYGEGVNGQLVQATYVSGSGWQAQTVESVPMRGTPAVLVRGEEVFLYSRGRFANLQQTSWSPARGWVVQDLDIPMTGSPVLAQKPGQIFLYSRGWDGKLQQTMWSEANGWSSVSVPQVSLESTPAVLFRGDEAFIFSRSPDRMLQQAYWSPGTGWQVLIASHVPLHGAPTVFEKNGEILLYSRGADNVLQQASWNSTRGWKVASIPEVPLRDDPTVRLTDNGVTVFGL